MDDLFDFPCSPTFRAYESELTGSPYEAPPETERRQRLLDAMEADIAWEQKQRADQYYQRQPEPRRRPQRPRPPRAEQITPTPPKRLEGPTLPSGRRSW